MYITLQTFQFNFDTTPLSLDSYHTQHQQPIIIYNIAEGFQINV